MTPAAWSAVLPDLGKRTHLMGILNVTPDSFSDGAAFLDPDKALDHALGLMDDGADIVDVGGESTRPGSDPVDLDTELRRVLPVIERLASHGVGPISIDTTKAEVARRAIQAGATIVNDISAGTFDPEMLPAAAAAGAAVVLMHTPKPPKELGVGRSDYGGDPVGAVARWLEERARAAIAAGVPAAAVAIDPGIGFGKDLRQNLALHAKLAELKRLGFPILVGPSRKSFLGLITRKPVGQRVFATAASVALLVSGGADIVRVHDVAEMLDVVRVADAVVRG